MHDLALPVVMAGVREYAEGLGVELARSHDRLVIRAFNEAGYNITEVDVLDVLDWLSKHGVIAPVVTTTPPQL